MEHKEEFTYTYCAAQQEEIENIRKKYLPREEDKLEQLRKLHRSSSQKAQAWALTIGIIGLLIMGTGMSLCMTEIADRLGMTAMLIGIPVGLLGMVLVACAYPFYNAVLQKERRRIAPEILRLSDELLK